MKLAKPKRYQYNCQLIDAWLTNTLPPSGGYYTGSSTYLECDSNCFWVGRDQEFLLAVKNRQLGNHAATLVRPVSDISFTGAVHDAIGCVAASFKETRTIRFFIPPEYRKRTHGFYQMEERDATGVPTVLVPRLTEDMATCSLESLHPAILAYYDRAFAKHFSNKYGASKQLLGHCVSGWREDGFHVPATQRVRETFNALNIPWKQEWSDMATLRTAKLRLAA